jgi:hypothetical protein
MMTQEEYVNGVLALKRQGLSNVEIAQELGYHPQTIAKWLKNDGPPPARHVDPAEAVIDERWARRIGELIRPPAEKLLATSVYEIISAEGFGGSYPSVVRHLRDLRGPRFKQVCPSSGAFAPAIATTDQRSRAPPFFPLGLPTLLTRVSAANAAVGTTIAVTHTPNNQPGHARDVLDPWHASSFDATGGRLQATRRDVGTARQRPTPPIHAQGTDLSVLCGHDLGRIAKSPNDRPRKNLEYMKPSEKLTELLEHTARIRRAK